MSEKYIAVMMLNDGFPAVHPERLCSYYYLNVNDLHSIGKDRGQVDKEVVLPPETVLQVVCRSACLGEMNDLAKQVARSAAGISRAFGRLTLVAQHRASQQPPVNIDDNPNGRFDIEDRPVDNASFGCSVKRSVVKRMHSRHTDNGVIAKQIRP